MRLGGKTTAILSGLAAAAILLGMPIVAATHWCPTLQVTTNPTTTTAGDTINYFLTVRNHGADPVDVSLRAQFEWESRNHPWGSLSVPPGEARTSGFSKVITNQPADYEVRITTQSGATVADGDAGTCPIVTRTLRVQALPEPPHVVLTASLADANASVYAFTATAWGGLAPLAFNWSFGDGTHAEGQGPVHYAFAAPGEYVVQVVVEDARGRLGFDRLVLPIPPPPTEDDGDEARAHEATTQPSTQAGDEEPNPVARLSPTQFMASFLLAGAVIAAAAGAAGAWVGQRVAPLRPRTPPGAPMGETGRTVPDATQAAAAEADAAAARDAPSVDPEDAPAADGASPASLSERLAALAPEAPGPEDEERREILESLPRALLPGDDRD